ncbi:hypothetical protein FQA39_LY15727 [Lamprigera yunnana]|nr:hypothetical protein FQA39_LY15727 [Lamprigera yunnana]
MKMFLVVLLAVGVSCAPKALDWRVVGGETAADGQFPYQVSIRYYDSHNCGGTIVNKNTILTAAHCLDGYSVPGLTVIVGTNHISEGGENHNVLTATIHPDYDSYTTENDIGIIKLASDITFNDKVQSVPLETENNEDTIPCILSGWGSTSYPGSAPTYLQFVHLKTITNKACADAHIFSTVVASHVCTLTKYGEGACHGDSGGPLVSENNHKQIGIVSWGRPCAIDYPDVFTRVSYFNSWINEHS